MVVLGNNEKQQLAFRQKIFGNLLNNKNNIDNQSNSNTNLSIKTVSLKGSNKSHSPKSKNNVEMPEDKKISKKISSEKRFKIMLSN